MNIEEFAMVTVKTIHDLQKLIREARAKGQTVGFVPTMGYFHEGHLSLIRRAKEENGLVVVSLFVNPIQFGPKEDLAAYPRDLKRDQELASGAGADIIFAPEDTEMYPTGYQTYVEVTEVSQGLCGATRPGHFRGVATVVLKLFNIVAADRAYFGEKDAQQLRVIRRMATDLNLPLEIIGCPIVREADGLAMSSRNVYLNPQERQAALVLYRALQTAKQLIDSGECDSKTIYRRMQDVFQAEPLAGVDYIEIVSSSTLKPLPRLTGEVLIAVAAKVGKTRLIDNMTFQTG
jgi:pantoate--beta-alanine ligase